MKEFLTAYGLGLLTLYGGDITGHEFRGNQYTGYHIGHVMHNGAVESHEFNSEEYSKTTGREKNHNDFGYTDGNRFYVKQPSPNSKVGHAQYWEEPSEDEKAAVENHFSRKGITITKHSTPNNWE